jgi:hypothetical protein
MASISTPAHQSTTMFRPTRLPRRDYSECLDGAQFEFQKRAVVPKDPWVPYWNPEPYLNDLRRNSENISEIEKLYEENPPEPFVDTLAKKVTNINPEPIYELYKKYSKPVKVPPLEERIRAFKKAGYSQEALLSVMQRDEKMKQDSEKLDQFIFNIFGDFKDKKASTKKKTLTQLLKIKRQVVIMPDIEPEENPNEDAEVDDDEVEV